MKGRNNNTIWGYRTDMLHLFSYAAEGHALVFTDSGFADLDFVNSITLTDMYGFITHRQNVLYSSAGTRERKIVFIRQFWKYLKAKAHLICNNIAEELETPKLPKRIPKYLTLEESVRLLIETLLTISKLNIDGRAASRLRNNRHFILIPISFQ